MFNSMIGALESGLLYAFMALGVYITFRILDFPDLTVDGSFTTGAAIAAVSIINGVSPVLASIFAFGGGLLAGLCTGLLHTKGRINGLMSGILMMIALYSINMRILGGKPNIALIGGDTLFTQIDPLIIAPILVILVIILLNRFLYSETGLALRATGDNERMIRSFGANTDQTKLLGISLSNGLVAFSGAMITQQSGFADISGGVGMIVIGLASVIIGEAVFGAKNVVHHVISVVLGSIVYRVVVALALRVEWLNASDMKIITAIIVIIALVLPFVRRNVKQKKMAQRRARQLLQSTPDKTIGGGL